MTERIINICISRIQGSSDYKELGEPCDYTDDELRRHPSVIDYKYFYKPEDNVLSLIIEGNMIGSLCDDNKFIEHFKNGYQKAPNDYGLTELKWFVNIIKDIINEIDTGLYGKIKDENKANLFIHWGGSGGYNATERLKKTARSICFPFNVYPWSTSPSDKKEIADRIKRLLSLDNSQKIKEYSEGLVSFL